MTKVEHIAEGVTLYLGDCRDLLPAIGRVDAIVTDPPYGIGFKYTDAYADTGGTPYEELLAVLKPFPRCLLQYPEETMAYLVPLFGPPDECFTWAYNSNTARQSRMFSFWGLDVDFKRVKVPAKNPTDPRVSPFVASYDWTDEFQQVKNVSAEKTGHPCQVPTALMERIIGFIDAEMIADPFLGSGTTGVAAVKLGRKFTGIEIEPKYFDIACRRIEQATRQQDMFIEKPKPIKQEAML
jgi:site-specific DNA-methyltransferase (adenine-specific)